MKKGEFGVAGALAALALLIAGCGGGGGTSTTESTESQAPLSKAAFIARADAICEVGNRESTDEVTEFAKENGFANGEPNKEQAEEIVSEVLVPNLERQADELRALGAPAGDEDKVEKILTSLEEKTGEIKKDPLSYFEGNSLEEPSQLEAAYGLNACGS